MEHSAPLKGHPPVVSLLKQKRSAPPASSETEVQDLNRNQMLETVQDRQEPWDIIVIGGGATGLGSALDSSSRGYDTVLFEQSDFAKATSSRSTKLVHGGVRYLQQGNVALVMEALKERGLLHRNAPHLVTDLAFVVPSYEWWESPFYGVGLKVYDLLAGRYGFGSSQYLSRDEVIAEIPSIRTTGLRGGIRYYDGQFDDARLAVNLAQTAVREGGTVLNYCRVTRLCKDSTGAVTGVTIRDEESGEVFDVLGRAIVNATGPFVDSIRRMDRPGVPSIISPSQGIHIVLDRSFLPGQAAIMVPHTDDGRVMFAIPWHDVAVVGTTDTAIEKVSLEPRPLPGEVEFILETANRYLSRAATASDIRSVFAGIRPLASNGETGDRSTLSRDHSILIDPDSGLLTVAGGKWTTQRRMGEDVIDQASMLAGLEPAACVTQDLPIHGARENSDRHGRLAYYGSDAAEILALSEAEEGLAAQIHERLPLTKAEVVWACRQEMAQTIDDVLARRSRSLLFDAQASIEAAPAVGEVMAKELGRDEAWRLTQIQEFTSIAEGYRYHGQSVT